MIREPPKVVGRSKQKRARCRPSHGTNVLQLLLEAFSDCQILSSLLADSITAEQASGDHNDRVSNRAGHTPASSHNTALNTQDRDASLSKVEDLAREVSGA